MARSYAAVKRPPAPTPSWPVPPAPAGGFARRPPSQRPENARPRPAADLNAPPDAEVAGEDARRRGGGAESNATAAGSVERHLGVGRRVQVGSGTRPRVLRPLRRRTAHGPGGRGRRRAFDGCVRASHGMILTQRVEQNKNIMAGTQ